MQYNNDVLELDYLVSDSCNLPFDLSPCFLSKLEFSKYIKNNDDYPLKLNFDFDLTKQINHFLFKNKINYIWIEDKFNTHVFFKLKKITKFKKYILYEIIHKK